MARRYDSRTTIFSPEGRLYQVREREKRRDGDVCPIRAPPPRPAVRAPCALSDCSAAQNRDERVHPHSQTAAPPARASGAAAAERASTSQSPSFFFLLPPLQVEYAMEAISNAGSAIGLLATDGVVLAAEKRITSKVRREGEREEANPTRASAPRSDQLTFFLFPAPRHQRRRRAPREDVPAGRPHRVRGGGHHR